MSNLLEHSTLQLCQQNHKFHTSRWIDTITDNKDSDKYSLKYQKDSTAKTGVAPSDCKQILYSDCLFFSYHCPIFLLLVLPFGTKIPRMIIANLT